MYDKLVRYIDVFNTTVGRILSNEYGDVYYINQNETLLNIKSAVFRQALSDNQTVDVQNCLKIAANWGDSKVYTCVQRAGHKPERVIAVNLETYKTIKELKE